MMSNPTFVLTSPPISHKNNVKISVVFVVYSEDLYMRALVV
jgi:hypothetical protein